jgi:hypothetical protein
MQQDLAQQRTTTLYWLLKIIVVSSCICIHVVISVIELTTNVYHVLSAYHRCTHKQQHMPPQTELNARIIEAYTWTTTVLSFYYSHYIIYSHPYTCDDTCNDIYACTIRMCVSSVINYNIYIRDAIPCLPIC